MQDQNAAGRQPREPASPEEQAGRRRSPLLVALVAAVALEAGLLVGVAGFYVVGTVGGRAADVGVAVTTAVMALLLGGALGFFARALWQGRRWSRAPIMTWNLLVVFSLFSTGAWRTGPGAAVVALSVAVAAGLLTPPVVRATSTTDDPPVT